MSWEEEKGYEYRQEYKKANYDVIRVDAKKGIKPILLKEFKKDGYNTMAAGLMMLITEYLKKKGRDV